MARTPGRPLHVNTTLTVEEFARLQARARLQGLSIAQTMRALIQALPAPTPSRSPDPATQRSNVCKLVK